MNELAMQIASDLSIYQFDKEDIYKYGNRIIYSALGCWAKMQVLGKSYSEISNDEEDYYSVTKRYISEKLKKIEEGLISAIPHEYSWVKDDEDYLYQSIVNSLIFCNELNRIGKKTNLTLSSKKEVKLVNNILLLGETDLNSRTNNSFCIGIGLWKKDDSNKESNYKDVFNIPKCSIKKYYEDILKNAVWEKCILNDEYEVFSGGTGYWHVKAWREFNQKYIPEGISLVRRKDKKYEFSLLLLKDNKFFSAAIDEWYTRENEYRRIMFALDYYRKKPAVFKAKKIGKVIELYCSSSLPNAETKILTMASWPKSNFKDKYVRQVPEVLWQDIDGMLKDLGIIVEVELEL